MYDVTYECARRDSEMDVADALQNIAEETVCLPRWVVQTLTNVARDLPHVLPSAVPDAAAIAYGRQGAIAELKRYLKPFEEDDVLCPF